MEDLLDGDEGEGCARPKVLANTALFLGSGAALAACGGEGSGSGNNAKPPADGPEPDNPAEPQVSLQQASRFLAQATNGPTRSEIESVSKQGYASWLKYQFEHPRSKSHWDWLVEHGFGADKYRTSPKGWDNSIWCQLISAPDQLRQRVALALLDIMVVGIDSIQMPFRQFAMAHYMDLLLDNAFGNFRHLLSAIATSTAMASFLTFIGSRKADAQGKMPDENFARELMQLFTVGLHVLNQDGTPRTDSNGRPIETFDQQDVSQLSRVFTGFWYPEGDRARPDFHRLPLRMTASGNETGTSSFLGDTVSGGGMAAVQRALDIIFAHGNVGPFVSRNLIKRLVTSNPSPAYVSRVAGVFANNGKGERGDLRAVIAAILMDDEARNGAAPTTATSGKLRDPVQRFTAWARACGAVSSKGMWEVGDLSDPTNALGQSPGHSPSVFNFFRPGYSPPNTSISEQGLVAPEFQITDEQSVMGYLNFMRGVVMVGPRGGETAASYSGLLELAAKPEQLIDEVNLVLAAGQLLDATRAAIKQAVEQISLKASDGALNRVQLAVLLTLASPDFLVLK